MLKIYGTTVNGINVYDASSIGGHVHADVAQYVGEALSKVTIDTATTYERFSVDMGKVVGVNHLVSTNENSIIKYMVRGNRAGATRFTLNQEAEESSVLNLILCVAHEGEFTDKWAVITAFVGEQGEREPWDASLKTPEAKAKAEAFWSTHALVPTEEERAQME